MKPNEKREGLVHVSPQELLRRVSSRQRFFSIFRKPLLTFFVVVAFILWFGLGDEIFLVVWGGVIYVVQFWLQSHTEVRIVDFLVPLAMFGVGLFFGIDWTVRRQRKAVRRRFVIIAAVLFFVPPILTFLCSKLF